MAMKSFYNFSFKKCFRKYCFLLTILAMALPIWAENPSDKQDTTQPMPYQGHYITAALGGGPYSAIGYKTSDRTENPWIERNPNNGIGWKVDYYWLPSHAHRKTVTFGVGLQYAGAHSHGKDKIVIDDFLYNSPQSLTINYIAPQCVMKIIPKRSNVWSFNVRVGVGLGHSAFSGKISRIPQGDNKQSFSNSKYGFGQHLGLGVEARVSRHFSLTADGTLYVLQLKNIMHNDVIPMYNSIDNKTTGVIPFSIGVCYHP